MDTSRLESLSPGTYTVTINDGAGCERVLESALYEQPELLFVIDELAGIPPIIINSMRLSILQPMAAHLHMNIIGVMVVLKMIWLM